MEYLPGSLHIEGVLAYDPGSLPTDPAVLVIYAILIVILLVATGRALARDEAQREEVSDLRQHGIRVMATVSHIEVETSATGIRNGMATGSVTSYIVVAHWTDPQTGNEYLFSSDGKSRITHAVAAVMKFPYWWIAPITIDIIWTFKRLPEAVG